MSSANHSNVLTLGLFEKRIEGDDCLLELARRRFAPAGMGAEMHAAAPEQLKWLMKFRPSSDAPVIVHLPRDFNLMAQQSQRLISDFATRFTGHISGMVLHDHPSMVTCRNEYIDAAWNMDELLQKVPGSPQLFIEYAVGLELDEFVQFFSATRDLDWISPCIDIGHVGIRAARTAYARDHDGEDVCALKTQTARLPELMTEVEAAVKSGYAAVLNLLERISAAKKPVHFHLHDAHPLSTASPFGVSDHLSFLEEVPFGFEHHGSPAVMPMFGPAGLSKIVARALELLSPLQVSFTLEIHPTAARLPLGDAALLFQHWTDKTNAEQMNHWLSVLNQNHLLLRQAIKAALPPEPAPCVVEPDFGPRAI